MRLAAIILALSAAFAAAAIADEQGPTLGNDLSGTACRLGPTSGSLASLRTNPILCGDAAEPAGALYAAPFGRAPSDDPAALRQALVDGARRMPGILGGAADATCDTGTPLGPEWQSLLFACTLTSNGWPRVVLLVAAGGVAFEGDGLPAMLPVLEAAISGTGGRVLSAVETEQGVRLLGQRFPGALAKAGGADAAADAALVVLARLAAAHDDYAASEASYRRALEIETRIFGDKSLTVGMTLMELALQVSNQTRFDEAQGLFDRAQPIIEASGDLATRARFQSYLALHAANQRHFEDALKFAAAATEMRRQELRGNRPTDLGSDQPQSTASRGELAHSLRIEAIMAMKLGDLPDALSAADEVLSIVAAEPGLPLWWRPDAVAMMADINAKEGRVVEAERQYREALVMDQKLFGDTAPTAFAELRLGRFYNDQQLYSGAIDVFRQAIDILDHDETARATTQPDQIIPFLAAAKAFSAQTPDERAKLDAEMFHASQLVSSDVEGRTIARAAARLAAGDPQLAALIREAQDTQRQRDAARISLAAETAKSDDQRDAATEQKLADALLANEKKAVELDQQIVTSFPDYAKLADPGPADLPTLERQLGAREAFLSYVVGATGAYALLVTHTGMSAAPIKENQVDLAKHVAELREAFVPRLGSLPPFDLVASYEEYQRLIGPFEKELAGIDHLIVAPTGALASLPLELLVTERPPARTSYGGAAWLVKRVAVSEVPSASAFLTLRQASARRVAAPRPLLAVGDPAFAGSAQGAGNKDPLTALNQACRSEGPIAPALLRALPPLHETAGEVRTVAKLLGAGDDALLLGSAATEAAFRQKPLDQYRVLYFATHGLLPGELHCQTEPGLVLSPPAQPVQSTAADGLLEASEIAALKLNADLVVLSACNTAASGGSFGGEALAGLADAFFNAGARTVLASNWEVPSVATARLMTQLFENFTASRDAGLAAALRQAQLALLRDPETAHPFNWAAFAVIGDGGRAQQLAPAEGAGVQRGRT